mmetsp:Transcript_18653/g.35210  ORF Transcript_18653/g.35210 Transcript_18653/m.35210 type:complete len:102 (+) Transcript_18653:428-733(+)
MRERNSSFGISINLVSNNFAGSLKISSSKFVRFDIRLTFACSCGMERKLSPLVPLISCQGCIQQLDRWQQASTHNTSGLLSAKHGVWWQRPTDILFTPLVP